MHQLVFNSIVFRNCRVLYQIITKMRFVIALCFFAIVMCIYNAEATYRKPPFNGSIFGKRGVVEYDTTGKALSALCEIAAETCQAWYQTIENK